MSRKIKSVTVLTEAGNKKILEAGVRGRVYDRQKQLALNASGVLSTTKSRPGMGGDPKNSEEHDKNLNQLNSTATQEILDAVFNLNETRVLLFLNYKQLRDTYLTSGGPKKIADLATNQEIASIFGSGTPNPTQQKMQFVQVKAGNTMDLRWATPTSRIDVDRPMCVLLDVPATISGQLRNINATSQIDQAREALAKIIDHSYYVGVLDSTEIRSANLGSLADKDARIEKFDIKKFIKAWPLHSTIYNARIEQEQREAARDDALVSEFDEIINDVVTAAVRFASKSLIDGVLNKSVRFEEVFKDQLNAILFKDNRVQQHSELFAEIQSTFSNDERIKRLVLKYPEFGSVLKDMKLDPDADNSQAPAPEQAPVKSRPEKKAALSSNDLNAGIVAPPPLEKFKNGGTPEEWQNFFVGKTGAFKRALLAKLNSMSLD